ncbi:DUF11 domain-containing protein [Defluviimonas salinarum]|uniref:DUF11 domain-containing protein n=1 Tax=Defluviimonas salinarum TaxID=2992147 RepID=A0ABT3J8B2_9RHOB|nr:DUF11 domain-containing protein [Defluviimonas salinarum]MCW3783927.1 DUF11 domain-containing protein [Defluviimonas salinarum]
MKYGKIIAAGMAVLLGSIAMAAANTPAGTLITNTVDISYTSGGNTISIPTAASSTIVVDREIDLSIAGLDAGAIVYAEKSADDAVLVYQLTNEGNAASGYDLNVAVSGSLALTLDPAGGGAEGTWHVVLSDNPVPGAGTEVVYDPTGTVNIGDLAIDGIRYVHIHANIGSSAASAEFKDFDITAVALDAGTNTPTVELTGQGLSGMDIVFNDPGFDGTETATETLSILAPGLTSSKTAVVISENRNGSFNCASGSAEAGAEYVIPGSCVEYTITVTNSASATLAAANLAIADTMPTDMLYRSLDKGGFDSASYSAGTDTVQGQILSLAPGSSVSMTIRAEVRNP